MKLQPPLGDSNQAAAVLNPLPSPPLALSHPLWFLSPLSLHPGARRQKRLDSIKEMWWRSRTLPEEFKSQLGPLELEVRWACVATRATGLSAGTR